MILPPLKLKYVLIFLDILLLLQYVNILYIYLYGKSYRIEEPKYLIVRNVMSSFRVRNALDRKLGIEREFGFGMMCDWTIVL
jgi:hypothetical protein